MWMPQQGAFGLWKARKVVALNVKRAAFDEVFNRLTGYVECWLPRASCRHLRNLSAHYLDWGPDQDSKHQAGLVLNLC